MRTVARADLCCEIYDKFGWGENALKEMDIWVIGKDGTALGLLNQGSFDLGNFKRFVPAYDTDFLLQKLPKFLIFEEYRYDLHLQMSSLSNDWFAWYCKNDENTGIHGIGKNPADAVASLALQIKESQL